jgi:hypothetical protein
MAQGTQTTCLGPSSESFVVPFIFGCTLHRSSFVIPLSPSSYGGDMADWHCQKKKHTNVGPSSFVIPVQVRRTLHRRRRHMVVTWLANVVPFVVGCTSLLLSYGGDVSGWHRLRCTNKCKFVNK